MPAPEIRPIRRRTKEQVLADVKALIENEINPLLDKVGDCGSQPLAFQAVLHANPKLKKRWDKLMDEGRDLEKAT